MLSCKQITENGSAILDGDLKGWRRMEARMHIFICGPCRRYVKQLKQTILMLGKHDSYQPSSELEERVCAHYKTEMANMKPQEE